MIDLKNFDFHLNNFNDSNRCLNDEEKVGLFYGMTNLEKLLNKETYFWGKIEGMNNDYYITYYLNYDNFFPEKIFYYCINDFEFNKMEKGNDTLIKKCEMNNPIKFFKGIPSSLYFNNVNKKNNENEKNDEIDLEKSNETDDEKSNETDDEKCDEISEHNEEKSDETNNEYDKQYDKSKKKKNENLFNIQITEIERLSYVVRKIDDETFIIPHNSLKITNTLEVKFATFYGFNILDSLKLSSWVHFRYPKNLNNEKINKCDTFFLTNFLDSIKTDNPKDMWNIKLNDQLNKIYITNFLYPGFYFYHILNTPFYASIYIGNGISNLDLPFMLP